MDGVVVKIPTGGIPARIDETLYGEYCDLYRIVDTDADDDTISLEAILDGSGAAVQAKVYNAAGSAASDDTYLVSELFRSGHRYVNPTSPDLRIWRVTFGQSSTTAATVDLGAWVSTSASGLWTTNPDVTRDGTAKTVTFNTAGYYEFSVQLVVQPATVAATVIYTCEVCVWRPSSYQTVIDSTSFLPTVTVLPATYGGSDRLHAFSRTYANIQADDVLAVRFTRGSSDTTTAFTVNAFVHFGRVWQ
jgi:hypothetical protein